MITTLFKSTLASLSAGVVVLAAVVTMNPVNSNAQIPAPNPLLAEWSGKYGGVPPFDKVDVADFKPALESAMAENLKEIDDIANNTIADPAFAFFARREVGLMQFVRLIAHAALPSR